MSVSIRDPRFTGVVGAGVEFERIATGCLFTEGPLWHPREHYLLVERHARRSPPALVRARRRHHLPEAVQQVQRPHVGPPGTPARVRARLEPGDPHRARRAHHAGRDAPRGQGSSTAPTTSSARRTAASTSAIRPMAERTSSASSGSRSCPSRACIAPARTRSGRCSSSTTSTGRTASASRSTAGGSSSTTPPASTFASSTCVRTATLAGGTRVGGDDGRGPGRARRHEDRLRRQRVLLRPRRHPRLRPATPACLGVIHVPEHTANFAWGDDDYRSLYITASTSVYRIRVQVPGLPAF